MAQQANNGRSTSGLDSIPALQIIMVIMPNNDRISVAESYEDTMLHLVIYSPTQQKYTGIESVFVLVRFEVFAAVTMKNGVFWFVTLCDSCKNLLFGGT
jgi:hypothetical protein